uniref:Uncharacterized protein n=1 Tax=Neovison vison TaxID=452646 RepID=A0A8C7BJD2_NEOVI
MQASLSTDHCSLTHLLWLVQRSLTVTAHKWDCSGTLAMWNREDPCFLDQESVCWASVFSARVVI